MEENDDSFIIDVRKLMDEFEKFLKSLSGAYDNLMKEKSENPSDGDIDSFFLGEFPDHDKDIRPFVGALKQVRDADWQAPGFMEDKDALSIYQVLGLFLLSIYKVG